MTFLASIVLIAAASGAASPPAPRVDIAAVGAIEFCASASYQSSIRTPAGYVFYQAAQGGLATALASRHIPTTATAPPLVQRFAATSPTARLEGSAGYLKVPSTNGEVGSGGLNTCDVMVTGVEKIAEVQNSIVNGICGNPKWTLLHSTQANATNPMSVAIFTQAAPTAGKPKFGMRLKVQALRSDFAKPDGIQFEANMAAGNLTITPTGITLSP